MKKLSKEQEKVMIKCGTEKPFSSKLLKNKKTGDYKCAQCGTKLFTSKDKFDSGTGWPSFSKAKNIETKWDFKAVIPRKEVICKKCKAHLGHIFNDGPKGKRYCINGIALDFQSKRASKSSKE